MKAFRSVSSRFFSQIRSDAMLAALTVVPLIMGLVFRFGVPALEGYLCSRTGLTEVLTDYYPVFDLLLSIMTPIMFTAAGAMVILDEADLGLARAISVTPVGREGYLASRIGVPAAIATLYCIAVTFIFRLSALSADRLVLLAISSGALSIATALMISTMAANKVEGLAYSKLSGLFVLGLPASLFLPAPYKYLAGFLPTLWMSEFACGGGTWLIFPSLISSAVISLVFAALFMRKKLS